MKDLLETQTIDYVGDQKTQDRAYKQKYREKMAREGMRNVTVKVPVDCHEDLKKIAKFMRENGHAPDMQDLGV